MGASPAPSPRVLHLVSSLEVGGKEQVVLDLAHEAAARGERHLLQLFDAPYRGPEQDLDPGKAVWRYEPRSSGFDLGFASRVRRAARGFDVLHAHNDTAIFYAALATLGRGGPGLMGTFHSLPVHDTPMARRCTRWATRRCHVVTAVSDELVARLGELGWSRPCRVIWNSAPRQREAAPEARARWRRDLRVADDEFLVGQVARCAPVKRQADLVAAVMLARARGVRIRAVFAGDGPDLAALRRAHADVSHLEFLGNTHDVPGLLAALDAFVLCSEHEAAPRALLEALAAGLPAVLTGVGGMPHIAGDAALYVPSRAPEELAAALERLASVEMRRDLAARARVRADAFPCADGYDAYAALWRATARHQRE